MAAQYQRNRAALRKAHKEWYALNKEQREKTIKAWREANPEKCRAALRRYAEKNPDRVRQMFAHRRLIIRLGTPKSLTIEQRDQIAQFYKDARALSIMTGVLHHVDHIVPLRGRNVCGLHVPWNLQVLTARANQRKSARFAA